MTSARRDLDTPAGYVSREPFPSPSVEVLKYAGVPDSQVARSLGRLVVLLAQRYQLDPALKHLEVLETGGKLGVYITADGWRFIADRSGEWNGLRFEHVERGDHGWRATALVWRKGRDHPFEGRAGCGDSEHKPDPEAQAMTRATRRALRNAFASQVRVPAEYFALLRDDDDAIPEPAELEADPDPEPEPATEPAPQPARVTPREQATAHRTVGLWPDTARTQFLARHEITDFGTAWPDAAVIEVLEAPF
jgi:hypothetical protein